MILDHIFSDLPQHCTHESLYVDVLAPELQCGRGGVTAATTRQSSLVVTSHRVTLVTQEGNLSFCLFTQFELRNKPVKVERYGAAAAAALFDRF